MGLYSLHLPAFDSEKINEKRTKSYRPGWIRYHTYSVGDEL